MNDLEFRIYDEKESRMLRQDVILKFGIAAILFSQERHYKVMQYTDLRDKNKKRYCQDDLVLFEGEVYRLIKGSYMFELQGFVDNRQDIPEDFFSERAYEQGEIIGNIYENRSYMIHGYKNQQTYKKGDNNMIKLTKSKTLEVFDENNIKAGDILTYKPTGVGDTLTVMVKEVSPFELTVFSLTHELKTSKTYYFYITPSEVERLKVKIAWKSN